MAGREIGVGVLFFVLVLAALDGNVSCRSLHVEARGTPNLTLEALPAKLDWRAKGAVSLPKDQGALGSCWAFAAVAAIEGLHKIKTGRLAALSAQQIVECSPVDGLRSPRNAFEWVLSNGGITSEADYPYTGRHEKCVTSKLKHYAAKITGYKRVSGTSELALMTALQKQPIAVSMGLHAPFFKSYKAGDIYNGPCTDQNNHAMTVVGYATSAKGVPYWIVKNSFGPHWGNNGYVHIRRGVNANNGGLCGIATRAIYPTMR